MGRKVVWSCDMCGKESEGPFPVEGRRFRGDESRPDGMYKTEVTISEPIEVVGHFPADLSAEVWTVLRADDAADTRPEPYEIEFSVMSCSDCFGGERFGAALLEARQAAVTRARTDVISDRLHSARHEIERSKKEKIPRI